MSNIDRPPGEGWAPWPFATDHKEHARLYGLLGAGQEIEITRIGWVAPQVVTTLPPLLSMPGLWWRVPVDAAPPEPSVADRMRDPATQADAAMERAQRSGDETAAATWAVASAVLTLRDALAPTRVEPAQPAVTREAVTAIVTASAKACQRVGGTCQDDPDCYCRRTIDALMALIGDAP
jgi:hypothetical protein